MQRKPAFPLTKCNIKLPLRMITPPVDATSHGEDTEQKRQLLLINFGHSQWGFNNWSWAVSKQVLDFIDSANGIYTAGIVSFVTVTVKNLDIHREHIGYATATAPVKGTAIYQARKLSVTAGLRETLLSFGGSVTISLLELLGPPQTTDYTRADAPQPPNAPPDAQSPDNNQENNQNAPNKPADPKNGNKLQDFNPPRKDSVDGTGNPTTRSPHPAATPLLKNAVAQSPPPVAKALPMPANKPVNPSFPANQPRPQPPLPHQLPRPNPNVSFVLQPLMGGVVPPMYGPPPRMPHVPPQLYPNYYAEYSAGPWHFTYEGYDRHHGNVNLNFNIPPKNLVVNSRTGECRNASGAEGEPIQFVGPSQNQGCWIKPTIFYDGFWTEQKVKKWVAEQVEKQFPEEACQTSPSSQSVQPEQTPKP